MSKVRINDLANEMEVKCRRFLTFWRNSAWAQARPTPVRWKAMRRRRFVRILSVDRGPQAHAGAASSRAPQAHHAQDRSLAHLQARRCAEGHPGQEKGRGRRGASRARAGKAGALRRRLPPARPWPRQRRRVAAAVPGAAPARPEPRKIVPQPRQAPPIVAAPPAPPAIATAPPVGAVVAKAPAGALAARPGGCGCATSGHRCG